MIDGREQLRRLSIFIEAMWEAREAIVERFEHETDRDELDWFERERFDEALEENRRVFHRLEEFRLQAAYDSEPVVKCTAKERSAAVRLALEMFEGGLSAETAVERVCGERFPHDTSE